ncbi:leucine-rich repeat and transmembrane domain-containing protein 1-like isoform X3 [Saccostrea cucullata]|uniref:leucine-rich repeat and transmembrane domain-containing protein 1-like isoform X3 n=1 Tax=Saccostrea cuccullata TaxID=36930 RepID=UPI002ED1606D
MIPKMNLIVWTLVLCVLIYEPVTGACPSGCYCRRSTSCNGTYVSCGGKGLTEVPTNIPTDTCFLDLRGNQITTVGDKAFGGLSKLETLWLSSNKITTIQNNTFNGLQNLKILWLHSNNISVIQSNAFHGLPNLQTLNLWGNEITELGNNIFHGLTKLQTL